ncbi:MAG TPA: penicillin-binding protein 2, partial [Solirubrobacterales bacterium]|nr:penicillin-binding protein 2 [Solirubrobacterales bacterium]
MRLIERRIGLLFAGFLLCFLVIVGRAFWLQGVRGGALASEAISQQTETVTVPGLRGSLLDRRGNELAASEDAATIYATPYQVENPAQAAEKLASILGLDEADVLRDLTADSGFSYIAHKVTLEQAGRVVLLGLEGIGELPDSRRTYPQGEMAGQVVGAVGSENQGLTGLEAGQEDVLRGSDGERQVVKDALGDPIRLETVAEASDGEDIQLTLDPLIQEKAERVLAEVGETYAPKGATAIVMNPESSEVLAMANWPPVDLNDLASTSNDDLANRATGFNYEPGSTFKAFTVAAALQEKLVTPASEFTLAPAIQVADRTIEESHPRGTETMSVATILAHSSNVGAVTIGLDLGAEHFDNWIHRFGFGRPTGVEYPGEEEGIVLPLDEYSGSTMGNLPLGQGISVTPMQMIAGYAAIANGGTLEQPRLIKRIGEEAIEPPPGKRVMRPEVAAQVREMLEGVLAPGGTASEVSVPGDTLAGKTGTAEIAENG